MESVSRDPVDEASFRAALGSFATGVGVMTTAASGGRFAMTANAVSSVSLDPRLVLVCVGRGATMAEHVVEAGIFAISFLAEGQSLLSDRFADPSTDAEEKFAGVATREAATGSPVLEGAVGWVDCRVHSVADGGDHLVVIGEVLAAGADKDVEPLVYFRGVYGSYAPA